MSSLNDFEIISELKIKRTDKVLDIGGSAHQHDEIKVDTLVDLERPEKTPYWPSPLRAKHFVKTDIIREKLPFADKEFDVCLCTHTLEDLYDPFPIISEMSRVAKRGYIATPSRGKDMEFSHFNLTDWLTGPRRQPGLSHHHWFFERKNDSIYIIPKIYPILYTSEFFLTKWTGEEEFRYFWVGEIKFQLYYPTSQHAVIAEYRSFLNRHQHNFQKGPVLFYWDSPVIIMKEFAKQYLHRGMAYDWKGTTK